MQARLIGTLVAACALAAITLPATAGASNGAQDYAVGDGTVHAVGLTGTTTNTNVRFSAQSGPNGEDPQGFVTGTYSGTSPTSQLIWPTGTFTGHVICLSVNGTGAVVMAKLDQTILTMTGPADMIALSVHDNGEPVGGENADNISTGFSLEATQVLGDCSTSSTSEVRPGNGNAVVHDAS